MLGPLIALVKLGKARLTAQSVSAPRSNGLMGEALSPMSTLSAVRFASQESREGKGGSGQRQGYEFID